MNPETEMNTVLKFLISLLIVLVILIGAWSCGSVIHATSNLGEVLEIDGDYAYVRMGSKEGFADYNIFFNVYFGHPIQKEDKVVLTTQRYLDSLLIVSQKSTVR